MLGTEIGMKFSMEDTTEIQKTSMAIHSMRAE